MTDPVHHRTGGPVEDNLDRALPEPPPPRAARRSAAIASALARFDGAEPASSAARPARSPRASAWWRGGRAQIAAFASIALVAMIAVPLAIQHPDGRIGAPPTAEAPVTAELASKASDGARTRAAISPFAPSAPSAPSAAQEPARSAPAAPARPADPRPTATASTDDVSEMRPPPSAAAMAPPPPPAPAPPAAPVASEALADASGVLQRATPAEDDAASIVVTGSRLSGRAKAAARRGDWNACTVADPDQSLRGCRGALRLGARGAAGAAGTRVAEGLSAGWRGDWDGAIAALDLAIALQPRLAIAHLNRGLVHQRLGRIDEAAADLDRAVRFEPSARSFHARSLLRHERGDERGARADEERAVELDADYQGLGER